MDYQNLINRDLRDGLEQPGPRSRRPLWFGLAAIPIVITSFFSFASVTKAPKNPATVTAEASSRSLAIPGQDLSEHPPRLALIPAADAGKETTLAMAAVDHETPPASTPSDPGWSSVTVQRGDSLARIFSRESLGSRTLHEIMSLGGATKNLTRIHPGDTLEYRRDPNQGLLALRYKLDQLSEILITREEDGFAVESIHHVPERRLSHAVATIESSLFLAAQKAGLSDNLTMELAGIFGYDIDFVLDIRAGDQFSVLYEELYLDGEPIGKSRILAADFTTQGQKHQAVRYTDASDNTDFYTPDGKSLRKAFTRTPVSFSRISSRFSLGRKHPVLNKIRAHKGVDYAASTGTPIMATGSGKVIHVGTKGGYGRTVILKHGQQYTTLYAHMSRYAKGLRTGDRVKQGQVIGYIGSSGLATGPHLHYEFRVNGAHRNPLTVKLPDAAPISPKFKEDFTATAETLMAQLETRKQLALAQIQPQARPQIQP